nr:zeta toxin family protein [Lactiplantibacillus plantarum]
MKVEYLYQNPLDAWNFIKERAAITGRVVPKKVFIFSFLASMENVIKVKRDFGDSIIVNVRVQDFVLNTKKVYNNVMNIEDKVPKVFTKIELEELLIDD